MVEIKRVSYAFNSTLDEPYFLDLMVFKDGITQIDLHKTFKSRAEFMSKMEEVIPILEDSDEDRREETKNVGWNG